MLSKVTVVVCAVHCAVSVTLPPAVPDRFLKYTAPLSPFLQLVVLLIAVIVVAALAYTCVKMLPYGPICALFGLVAGVMKYRKVTQFNSLTVQRFKNTYKDCYDAKKLNAYVDKMF